jgi:hypothetical protein
MAAARPLGERAMTVVRLLFVPPRDTFAAEE